MSYVFTSESVTEGHPDKVSDCIADSLLDALLEQDPASRVACEVLCKNNTVVVAGEITSRANVDYDAVVRGAVAEIGYTTSSEPFNADGLKILKLISAQAPEIDQGVTADRNLSGRQGAGDQGLMFGYATNETPELMPLPILLAHRLAYGLATARKSRQTPWMRPDGKTQVSVLYENDQPVRVETVLVSTAHQPDASQEFIRDYVCCTLLPERLGPWFSSGIRVLVNPTGSFGIGGPSSDCGVTGRKIIVDTYGGAARHGGGALSGKDPSKVDRSGAYFCRFAARQLVKEGIARKAEIQVSYAIGVPEPLSIKVDVFGTGVEHHAAE